MYSERSVIRNLPADVVEGTRLEPSARIAVMQQKREGKHDQRVLVASSLIAEILAACASECEEAFQSYSRIHESAKAQAEELLVISPVGSSVHDDLSDRVAAAMRVYDGRLCAIDACSSALVLCMDRRQAKVTSALVALAKDLLVIGHAAAPEVEWIVTSYTSKENADVDAMRLGHASKIECLCTAVEADRSAWASLWQASEQAWRLASHESALESLAGLLTSQQYTAPAAHDCIVAHLHETLQSRHESERVAAVRDLLQLRPPRLSVETVAGYRQTFARLAVTDAKDVARGVHALTVGGEDSVAAALEEIERAGAHLVAVGAHAPSGRLPQLGAALREAAASAEKDDAAGNRGLGDELASLYVVCEGPLREWVHEGPLHSLTHKTRTLLAAATQLLPALVACGAEGPHRTSLSLLRALWSRSTHPRDTPGLLASLHPHLAALAAAAGARAGLGEVCACLDQACEDVSGALEAAGEA